MASARQLAGVVSALVFLGAFEAQAQPVPGGAPAFARVNAPALRRGLAKARQIGERAATGTIRGVVLDRADGSPIADVSVRLQDSDARSRPTTPDGSS